MQIGQKATGTSAIKTVRCILSTKIEGLILFFFFVSDFCSSKVISAFLETSDPAVSGLAKKELQPLIDSGVLRLPEIGNKADNEG